jgi:hypothetical protein
MQSSQVCINLGKAQQLAELLSASSVPPEQEASGHTFTWSGTLDELANAYFAIVAICHQTSPIGERQLTGKVNGKVKVGWDYLREMFLIAANEDKTLTAPDRWQTITPWQLAELYEDNEYGKTLSRINERALLLNDLGRCLCVNHLRYIREVFDEWGRKATGNDGFLAFISGFKAYSDPLRKKSLFFLSLASSECGWSPSDRECLLSPIDYHELRGHLRIGTIIVHDDGLLNKLHLGLPITDSEDYPLREAAQEANNYIAAKAQVTNSALHYLFWNIFRSCCPRGSSDTHCSRCADNCRLPIQYKQMDIYSNICLFAGICSSAHEHVKLCEPPYVGHYY